MQNLANKWNVSFGDSVEVQIVCDGLKKSKDTPVKRILGEFKHVRLTDVEILRLKEEYGEHKLNVCIKVLDEYIETKGKNPYANHNLVIRKWVLDRANEIIVREGTTYGNTTAKVTQRNRSDFTGEEFFG